MKKSILTISVICVSMFLLSAIVDLNNLFNYENQITPVYISNDNTPSDNAITDRGATLGRVLFYDKNLSVNNTIACASCHDQEYAFGDLSVASLGVNGSTGRHSMRLINARYSNEEKAFWDERADSFEDQAAMPIQDHVEMGFSGENGDPGIDSLINKLGTIEYYSALFEFVFEDDEITEDRIKKSLAQFVRSIESFDSRFDEGRAQVNNTNDDFPNYTDQENQGKNLYFSPPPQGGAGCFRCHQGPEFSMISNCENNGNIGVIGNPDAFDLEVTKAPTLRDLVNPEGVVNGPFMHDGSMTSLMDVINHYNDLEELPENTNLDFRLAGAMHDLDMSQTQKEALEAFLLTLTGVDVYTNVKWSSPFDDLGGITIIPYEPIGIENIEAKVNLNVFPNPFVNQITINLSEGQYQLIVINENGMQVKSTLIRGKYTSNWSDLSNGVYVVQIIDLNTGRINTSKIIKQ